MSVSWEALCEDIRLARPAQGDPASPLFWELIRQAHRHVSSAQARHKWEPYAGILTREPYASQVRKMGLGPHSRTCSVCGLITDHEDDCRDLECTPGRHR